MIDPLTAIGLAGNVVQFVDFGARLISTGRELYQSEIGALINNLEIEAIALHLTGIVGHLAKTSSQTKGPREAAQSLTASGMSLIRLAELCEEIARDLIMTLGRIKKQNSGRVWGSVRQALSSIWSHDKIDGLLKRLVQMRDEIALHLLTYLSESQDQVAKALTTIQAQTAAQTQTLGKLHRDLRQDNLDTRQKIISAIHHLTLRPGNDEHVNQLSFMLSDLANGDIKSTIEQRLLHSLSYPRMAERAHRVVAAHEGTLKWSFDWKNLSQWLRRQGGLYWINGKAGAGKSTFMKFLQNHERTRSILSEWSGKWPLVIAGFYFWNPGTAMQKSQSGLLQSLLYEIIKQSPELLPQVLPLRWQSYSLYGADLHPWSLSELGEAFDLIASEGTKTHKFCFFIDGLDEFDGSHRDLIRVLRQLSLVPNIKICVSSRPWNIFQDAFASDPSLMLQNLTQNDMQMYVKAEFAGSAHFELLKRAEPVRAPRLISEIVEKSSGVFLWVYLVTRSLQEGLTDADRLEDLERRLEQMPADLEEFFMHTLRSVNNNHFWQATQLFRIMLESPPPLSLLTLSYFDEANADFALKMRVAPLTDAQVNLRCDATERKLNSRCKGLLEVHSRPMPMLGWEAEGSLKLPGIPLLDDDNRAVFFLHRTVKDFLNTPTVQVQLVAKDDDFFCASIVMLRMLLARLKTVKSLKTRTLNMKQLWQFVGPAIELAKTAGRSNSSGTARLLEELDMTASFVHAAAMTDSMPQDFDRPEDSARPSSTRVLSLWSHWSNTRLSDKGEPSWADPWYTSFITFAVENDLEAYIAYKLDNDPELLSRMRGPPLLLMTFAAPQRHWDMKPGDSALHDPRIGMMRLLFERGADPNQSFLGHTVWERVLSWQANDNNRDRESLWEEAVRLFRMNGADPSIATPARTLKLQASSGADKPKKDLDASHRLARAGSYSSFQGNSVGHPSSQSGYHLESSNFIDDDIKQAEEQSRLMASQNAQAQKYRSNVSPTHGLQMQNGQRQQQACSTPQVKPIHPCTVHEAQTYAHRGVEPRTGRRASDGISMLGRLKAAVRPKASASSTPSKRRRNSSNGDHRTATQRTILSDALSKAHTAVRLDNAQDFGGAVDVYAEACELLREVMLRSADDESIKKYAALSSSYLNRIDELRRIVWHAG